MNIVFLDFDGVLNSVRSRISQLAEIPKHEQVFSREEIENATNETKAQWNREFEDEQWNQLDRIAVGLIAALCKEAPAKVVISSTWRLGTDTHVFNRRFKSLGFSIPVIDRTPSLNNGTRGDEIARWLANDSHIAGDMITNYVILDDDSDMLMHQKLYHFVHVKNTNGMQLEHYRAALRILNPEHRQFVVVPG